MDYKKLSRVVDSKIVGSKIADESVGKKYVIVYQANEFAPEKDCYDYWESEDFDENEWKEWCKTIIENTIANDDSIEDEDSAIKEAIKSIPQFGETNEFEFGDSWIQVYSDKDEFSSTLEDLNLFEDEYDEDEYDEE